ncbi:MAG: hypothetical protein FJW22_11930 [Acidimicrobiia bacterium]|nr:hypothetical protein [Acidimicrobiia bacterium]
MLEQLPTRNVVVAVDGSDHATRARRLVGGLSAAVDRGDVGVIQRGEDFGFAREACEAIRVGRQHFDGDLALGLRTGVR